jgi:hypothetical protein
MKKILFTAAILLNFGYFFAPEANLVDEAYAAKAVRAEKKNAKPACGERGAIQYREEKVNIYIEPDMLRFMLVNLAVCGKLAREIGITEFDVSEDNSGELFSETFFKISIEDPVIWKKVYHYSFDYRMGMEAPFPIMLTGQGNTKVKFSDDNRKSVLADFNMEFCPGKSPLDDLTYRFPIILKIVFTAKMEKVIRQAEKLGDYFENDTEYLLEIIGEDEEVFSGSEKQLLRNFIKGAA